MRAACLAIAVACGGERTEAPARAAPVPATAADGQWIWTDADLALWRAAHARRPALRAGVWVSTLGWSHGAVVQRLARSPRVAGHASLAVVVRIEDGMHAAWAEAPDSLIAVLLDARLAALLDRVAVTGVRVDEVQLDYDCPVRRLPRWAAVVSHLRTGALRGREVWVTSLGAHVSRPDYGPLFRGVASGHIVQLFDTGDRPDATAVPRLAAALVRAGMPYRVGLGAFERAAPTGARTRHRVWFAALPALAASSWYRGVWVFPGGQSWEQLMGEQVMGR